VLSCCITKRNDEESYFPYLAVGSYHVSKFDNVQRALKNFASDYMSFFNMCSCNINAGFSIEFSILITKPEANTEGC